MTLPVILAGFWIVAASIIAFLPQTFRKPAALFLIGFGSMPRRPVYFPDRFLSCQTRGLL